MTDYSTIERDTKRALVCLRLTLTSLYILSELELRIKYLSWKFPEVNPNPRMLFSSLNFIIPCLDASPLLAKRLIKSSVAISNVESKQHCDLEKSLICVITQVVNHQVHSMVLLNKQMGVSARGVKDG